VIRVGYLGVEMEVKALGLKGKAMALEPLRICYRDPSDSHSPAVRPQ
jgi:hypothetical protein